MKLPAGGKIALTAALLGGAALAAFAMPFLPSRAAQVEASRDLREHHPLEAYHVSSAALGRGVDEPHLRELAVAGASGYVDALAHAGREDEALSWGRTELAAHPYLAPLAKKLDPLANSPWVNALAQVRGPGAVAGGALELLQHPATEPARMNALRALEAAQKRNDLSAADASRLHEVAAKLGAPAGNAP